MRTIEHATSADRQEILKLYKIQLGREFCPWNEDYPGEEEIDFDLSRESLLVMREDGKIIAAISIDD
ncbi:MAG: GNAT family N-acetyltransferase, partial [Lachnospiraceae bacterium]|nr:GNAT family N-acetyltransferase [Lachnospiraceae bacterium]